MFRLASSIPKVLAVTSENETEPQALPSTTYPAMTTPRPTLLESSTVNLQPEIEPTNSIWTSVDLVLTMKMVKLHLYDGDATLESDLKTHGVARFALTSSSLRCKVLTDGAAEAELVIKSLTMSNTRVGPTRFREIIPAAQHHRNQFMVLYTTSGGTNSSSLVIVTVDSPKIIFSVDPVFSLLDFFSNAPEFEVTKPLGTNSVHMVANTSTPDFTSQRNSVDFRIDLHDVIISVLENDTMAETQAIQLSIKQVLISQQVSFFLTFSIPLDTSAPVGYPCTHRKSAWHVIAAYGQTFGWRTLSG